MDFVRGWYKDFWAYQDSYIFNWSSIHGAMQGFRVNVILFKLSAQNTHSPLVSLKIKIFTFLFTLQKITYTLTLWHILLLFSIKITNYWFQPSNQTAPLPRNQHDKHINHKNRHHLRKFRAISHFGRLIKTPPLKKYHWNRAPSS